MHEVSLRVLTSGHVTKMAVTPPFSPACPATRKLHGSMFYRTAFITDQNFTLLDTFYRAACNADAV